MKTTSLKLTDEQIVFLDGCGDEVIQTEVDKAKDRLATARSLNSIPGHIAKLVADVVEEAKISRRIVFASIQIRTCSYCDATGGYAKHKGTGRWHKKGDLNYDRPLHLRGYEFATTNVRMVGYPKLGACSECVDLALPFLRDKLVDVEAEIPESLTGKPPRFRSLEKRTCKRCGWIGHEEEMGKMRTLMGDGHYPGICPQCGARNEPLGETIVKLLNENVLVSTKDIAKLHEDRKNEQKARARVWQAPPSFEDFEDE